LALAFICFAAYGVIQSLPKMALWGLPDIGDPFDVAAVRDLRVPDDQNAWLLYREALAQHKACSVPSLGGLGPKGPPVAPQLRDWTGHGWAGARPEIRAWLEANRPALALWRQATHLPDCQAQLVSELSYRNWHDGYLRMVPLAYLARLEADRLCEAGKMSDAWDCHAAILRSSRHVGMNAPMPAKCAGSSLLREAADWSAKWASDPRVDAPLLRRARHEVAQIETMNSPYSTALKVEYLIFMKAIEDRSNEKLQAFLANFGIDTSPLRLYRPDGWFKPHYTAESFWRNNEPERSRRVIRLLVANWLAYCDRPKADRAPEFVGTPSLRGQLGLFKPGPEAPPQARVLSPQEITEWTNTALFAKLFPAGAWSQLEFDREQYSLARLEVNLAEQLMFRQEGRLPRTPQELVGTYLGRIPEPILHRDPILDAND
jgi:hypothetical protein